MKKLNNKGITTIEVIICFVLVVTITVSMYATISYFNEKRLIENYKEQIYSYKDLLTKDIQDDFIKIGLTHAEYKKELTTDGSNTAQNVTKHTVNCTLKDGSKRVLIIEQRLAKSSYHLGGITGKIDDYFMIRYGKENELVEYPLPDLGHSMQGDSVSDANCQPNKKITSNCHTVQDLSINNVLIKITDENVLSIYVGFYHPDLSTRYGINIIAPIDYVSDGGGELGEWNYGY